MNGTPRVGLYVQQDTRERLNLVKAKLSLMTGESQSQDDALNWLIEQSELLSNGQPNHARPEPA